MLRSFYQNYATLFENIRGTGFLDLSITGAELDLNKAHSLAQLFILSDLLTYVGIVVIVFVIGARYSTSHSAVTELLVKISGFFCYISLFANIFGIFSGWEILSAASISIFSGLYVFNLSTQFIKILLLLLTGALYAFFPVTVGGAFRTLELPLLMQITLALCITMISAANFALILLALEGFSLTLYIMTALGRTYGGITASVKYFAFGTLGSIFLFWGVVHIYAIVPSLSTEVVSLLFNAAHSEKVILNNSLDFATTAIAFGFMIKLGAAPTHQWVADVYAGVHFYITAYFSVFVKCVLFLIFLRTAMKFNCDAIVTQFTIISLLVGCFMSINQTEIKRLLAYSSIVHVGFLFMGDATSSLVYLITYLISSLVIFSVMLSAEVAGKELVYMNDLRFIRKGGQFGVFSLVVALASSAGLPPFAGFYGKFLVWTSLIEDIYLTNSLSAYCTLFVSVAITLITIFYYMRVIAYLFMGHDAQISPANSHILFSDFYGVLFSMQGILVLLVIFWSFVQPYVIAVSQITAVFF